MLILLIEDNELNRDMLSRRLDRKGYQVICAENGQDGYELAKNKEPKLILMDLSLPIIDGWTLAGKLKDNSITKKIPIIALTAHAMKGDREKALNSGCDDYDTKPVDLDRLLLKMNKLLS
tara:strand:+ start:130 stop:489 length:360 start_codon:yes stop_codon:yes gene_type:complete